ncbi:hypothetical protein PHK61_14185 [Actinomycetospora lutea]|uniref:hypothetical protein n=1 Tax=Actinomycetospora lutea TaxID=663604 RepID=UPI0023668A2D|nr:hypothetical protein [Actinomycetospora lutea]MDD7939568.1 hypothetical protein [Actinomycetospora lutea]
MTTAQDSATTPAAPEDLPESAPTDPTPGSRDGDRVADVLDRGLRRGAAAVDQIRDRLPADPVPIYLGITALAVTGLVSWPVAVAAGCGYAAFRHWEPRPSGPHHPVATPDRG